MATGYDADLTDHLEMLFGDGFLSSGGPASIARMIGGADLSGAVILDIGSGLGAVCERLVTEYGAARVVGVDVEPHLVRRSEDRATAWKLTHRLCYRLVAPEAPLPFPDDTFDVVFSKEAILHVRDKAALFREIRRVLRAGGRFIIVDWLRGSGQAAPGELERFLEIDGLPFHLCALPEYMGLLKTAGLAPEMVERHTSQSLEDTLADLHKVRVGQRTEMERRFAPAQIDDYVESWRLQERLLRQEAIEVYRIAGSRA